MAIGGKPSKTFAAITATEFYSLPMEAKMHYSYFLTLQYRGSSNIWTWYFPSEAARKEHRAAYGSSVLVLSEGRETLI